MADKKKGEWSEPKRDPKTGLQLHEDGLPLGKLARAKALEEGPIVLLDHYDNAASGGTMDSMTVLRAVLEAGLEDVAVFARGPGAEGVHGSFEQNALFHLMVQANPPMRRLLCRRGDCSDGKVPDRLPAASTSAD